MVEQSIEVYRILEFTGIIITIIVSTILIGRALKKGYQNYTDNKIKIVDMKMSNMKREIEENQKQNEKEHDRLTLLFDKIDDKLNRLLEK